MGGRPECGQGRCPPGLRPIFEAAARETGLPVALLEAVAEAESGFNPRAVSPAGAAGLMQLMPSTARALGVTDVFDPWQNVLAGARYLRGLLDRFGSLELALAAYNAGPGAVEKWGGVPRYRETRSYVSKILASLGRDPGGAPPCSAVPATKNAVWVWSR
ncbi:lytic transglycosylase domain-containing protein [Thermanaeromonas toyohensis]|nr:lytic transglycosylase domain-containing protein [Thermanaeromonas toyohensis]